MKHNEDNLTGLLLDWSSGDEGAAERIFEQLYPELKGVAQKQLSGERAGHTVQPTALVHEAFLKFQRGSPIDWQNRAHFFAIASRIIRQILVDYGRARNAQRRGGADNVAVTLDENIHGKLDGSIDLLELDSALTRLAVLNERQAEIVALRYFGGLTIEEVATTTGLSESTVNRQWRAARAWLYRALEPQ